MHDGKCIRCQATGPIGQACTSASCEGLHLVPIEHCDERFDNPRSYVGRMVGNFLIVRPLGQDGFGSVYLALKKPNFHTKGALKLFDPVVEGDDEMNTVLRRYFMREIKTLSTLNEPNIVQLIDEGTHNQSPYLVMRYVEGGTLLRKHMTLGQPAPVSFIKSVVTQILRALKAAHGSGIVHRDLKPENIMLQGEANHVYVLDFGLAKRVDERFLTTATFGTPYYMAPEQLFPSRKALFVPYWESQPELAVLDRHVGQVGPACDLYAVGVMVGELMTGRPIFQSHSTAELSVEKDKHREDPVANLQVFGLPDEVMAFLRKSLAYLPTARYTSAEAFQHDFDEAMICYEGFLKAHPEALTSENVLPPKDRTSVAFHSTKAFEDEPIGLADTQALSEQVEAREVVRVGEPVDVIAAQVPDDATFVDTTPTQVRLPQQLSQPTGPPKTLPEDAPSHQSKPTRVEDEQPSTDEPIYQYMSPVIIYGLVFTILGLLGVVAYLVTQDDENNQPVKPDIVITDYDRALESVRNQVKMIPAMLDRGEYAQVIELIKAIDSSEARLTPKEHQSVVEMLKIAQKELPHQKKLDRAKTFFEKEQYMLSLGQLSKIGRTSRVRKLQLFEHIEMASEDAIMRKVYNDVLIRNNKESARLQLQSLLQYDPKLKDARALLLKLESMPLDAPMAIPQTAKKE